MSAVVHEAEPAARIPLPFDAHAEALAIAHAVATPTGHEYALSAGLTASAFYTPRWRRTFAVLAAVADEHDQARRIGRVALLADVPERELSNLVNARPLMWDATGRYAAKVIHAATRRKAMSLAAQLHDQAAKGGGLADLALLASQLQEVVA